MGPVSWQQHDQTTYRYLQPGEKASLNSVTYSISGLDVCSTVYQSSLLQFPYQLGCLNITCIYVPLSFYHNFRYSDVFMHIISLLSVQCNIFVQKGCGVPYSHTICISFKTACVSRMVTEALQLHLLLKELGHGLAHT